MSKRIFDPTSEVAVYIAARQTHIHSLSFQQAPGPGCCASANPGDPLSQAYSSPRYINSVPLSKGGLAQID